MTQNSKAEQKFLPWAKLLEVMDVGAPPKSTHYATFFDRHKMFIIPAWQYSVFAILGSMLIILLPVRSF
jgi:hypothetical protein